MTTIESILPVILSLIFVPEWNSSLQAELFKVLTEGSRINSAGPALIELSFEDLLRSSEYTPEVFLLPILRYDLNRFISVFTKDNLSNDLVLVLFCAFDTNF
jgi:hypothetical protein